MHERSDMLNPQKTLEREALLKRIRELDAEIAQHERNMREGEARLPLEEQLRLKLRRFIGRSRNRSPNPWSLNLFVVFLTERGIRRQGLHSLPAS
jgi:hypothetical protein